MEPFASVSNLANLSVEIPLGLQEKGNDVRCLMPKYGFISERKYNRKYFEMCINMLN